MMNRPTLTLTGMGEVAAAVPHILGVCPEQSVVVFPTTHDGRPTARVDIPADTTDFSSLARALKESYGRLGGSGPVVILAFADRLEIATDACATVAAALEHSHPAVAQVAVQGDEWVRLDVADSGTITPSDRDKIAASFVYAGRPQPFQSTTAMRASFARHGPDLTEPMLLAAGHAVEAATVGGAALEAEKAWVVSQVESAIVAGRPINDADAARLLCDVQLVPLRDEAWAMMTKTDGPAHAALWKDLLTRCPDAAKDPVASLAAFGAWLAGDGLQARMALEQVADPDYHMAKLIGVALQHGLNPADWTPLPTSDSTNREPVDPSRRDPRRDPPHGSGPRPDAPRR